MLDSFKLLLTKGNILYPNSELFMVLIFTNQETKDGKNAIYSYEFHEKIWVAYFAKAIIDEKAKFCFVTKGNC